MDVCKRIRLCKTIQGKEITSFVFEQFLGDFQVTYFSTLREVVFWGDGKCIFRLICTDRPFPSVIYGGGGEGEFLGP